MEGRKSSTWWTEVDMCLENSTSSSSQRSRKLNQIFSFTWQLWAFSPCLLCEWKIHSYHYIFIQALKQNSKRMKEKIKPSTVIYNIDKRYETLARVRSDWIYQSQLSTKQTLQLFRNICLVLSPTDFLFYGPGNEAAYTCTFLLRVFQLILMYILGRKARPFLLGIKIKIYKMFKVY